MMYVMMLHLNSHCQEIITSSRRGVLFFSSTNVLIAVFFMLLRDRGVFTYHIPLDETRRSHRCPQASWEILLAVTSGLVNDEAAIVWWWKQQFNESVLIHMAAGLGHGKAASPHPKTGSEYGLVL